MIICKIYKNIFSRVIATKRIPINRRYHGIFNDINLGELIILFEKTSTKKSISAKIRCVMRFQEIRRINGDKEKKLWWGKTNRKWDCIIRCDNCIELTNPIDLSTLLYSYENISAHSFVGSLRFHCIADPRIENIIRNYIRADMIEHMDEVDEISDLIIRLTDDLPQSRQYKEDQLAQRRDELLDFLNIDRDSDESETINQIITQISSIQIYDNREDLRGKVKEDIKLFLRNRHLLFTPDGRATLLLHSIRDWIRSTNQQLAVHMQNIFSREHANNTNVYHEHNDEINTQGLYLGYELLRRASQQCFKRKFKNGTIMYRGLRPFTIGLNEGNINIIPSCLSSWTPNENIARRFASGGGYIVSFTVTAESIAIDNDILESCGHSYRENEYILLFDRKQYPDGWLVQSRRV